MVGPTLIAALIKRGAVVKFSRNAVPPPLTGVPPPIVGIPAEFNHWDKLNINIAV